MLKVRRNSQLQEVIHKNVNDRNLQTVKRKKLRHSNGFQKNVKMRLQF